MLMGEVTEVVRRRTTARKRVGNEGGGGVGAWARNGYE